MALLPKAALQDYTRTMGGLPIQFESAEFGWVHRARLFWGHGPTGSPAELPVDLPEDLSLTRPTSSSGKAYLRYTGPKPVPQQVCFQAGYTSLVDPRWVVDQKGVGAMHCFAREFPRPKDKLPEASPQAAAAAK